MTAADMTAIESIQDYDYHLPPSLIAQKPCEPRDAARLLLLNRESGSLSHLQFQEFPNLLNPGDCLVFNDTRVHPARIHARKVKGGGAVEILLLRRLAAGLWRVLVRGRGINLGTELQLQSSKHPILAIVTAVGEGGQRDLQFEQPILSLLSQLGEVPLPPYIQEPVADSERYQTIYGKNSGSAAAPTAGLHFTHRIFHALKDRGAKIAFCTLHIGLDTFQPIRVNDIAQHTMHSESVELGHETAAAIQQCRAAGRRVFAIGTTTARALETAARSSAAHAVISPYQGETRLFIRPGYEWQVVDALLTNFHLPKSTLLLMVSALVGREEILHSYEVAVRERYRFYSFGDAMLIL